MASSAVIVCFLSLVACRSQIVCGYLTSIFRLWSSYPISQGAGIAAANKMIPLVVHHVDVLCANHGLHKLRVTEFVLVSSGIPELPVSSD